MSVEGTIVGGQVELDAPTELPDGTRVSVETLVPNDESPINAKAEAWLAAARKEREGKPLTDLQTALLSLSGRVEGLPPDFSVNHNHYIHGTRKR